MSEILLAVAGLQEFDPSTTHGQNHMGKFRVKDEEDVKNEGWILINTHSMMPKSWRHNN
jgi:hypothetical protein